MLFSSGVSSEQVVAGKVGDVVSSWELPSRGVPPGSVLGPLLFNVFLNDLAHFVIGAHLNAYADDQKLYYSDTDHLALLTQLNNELSVAVDWLKHNG